MAGARLIVLYPAPTDVNAFEQAYTREHVQMVDKRARNKI